MGPQVLSRLPQTLTGASGYVILISITLARLVLVCYSFALKWCLQHYKSFVRWSSGFSFKAQEISYSGRQPTACQIHSPKNMNSPEWSHWFPIFCKANSIDQGRKLVLIWAAVTQYLYLIQEPQESCFLAGSDWAVHGLSTLSDHLPGEKQHWCEQRVERGGSLETTTWKGAVTKYFNSYFYEHVNAKPETLQHPSPHLLTYWMLPWLRSAVLMHYHTSLEGSVNNNLLG